MPTITRTGHALAGSPSHSHYFVSYFRLKRLMVENETATLTPCLEDHPRRPGGRPPAFVLRHRLLQPTHRLNQPPCLLLCPSQLVRLTHAVGTADSWRHGVGLLLRPLAGAKYCNLFVTMYIMYMYIASSRRQMTGSRSNLHTMVSSLAPGKSASTVCSRSRSKVT